MNKDEVSCIDDVIEVIKRVKDNYENEYDEVVAELDAVTAQRDAAVAERDELRAVAERLCAWGRIDIPNTMANLTDIIMDANRAIAKEQS